MIYTSEENIVDGDKEADERKKVPPGDDRHSVPLASRASSTPPASSPRAVFSFSASSTASSASPSRKANEEDERDEEEGEEEEEDELPIKESNLNALFRIFHSHILRQQMIKVRRERDPRPNLVGMGKFF
uniref:Uncharacterized protein n=1 Tax=Globodera pallida TaxID=36090 RepID=A0A183BI99_GLOPA